jgi:hypothetical protein
MPVRYYRPQGRETMMGGSAALIDETFFLVSMLVTTVVALVPVSFFRAITLGRFNPRKTSPALLRTVRILAAIVAVLSAIRVVMDLLR